MEQKPIILDCLGGDSALEANVAAVAELVSHDTIPLLLVGPESEIRERLAAKNIHRIPSHVRFVSCDVQFGMDRQAQDVLKEEGNSIYRALTLLQEGQGSIVVSAGHTGAVFIAAVAILGRIDKISRPALGVIYPTVKGRTLLLDAGANVDCRAMHLMQFGALGAAYYGAAYGKDMVDVGLLNNGEESTKGCRVVREAHELMGHTQIPHVRWVGMVDASEVFMQAPDVLIADGFVGNILVKSTESLVERFGTEMRRAYSEMGWISRFGMWLSVEMWKTLKRGLDFREVGGAPLLGLKGNVFVCHGRSDGRTIAQGVRRSANLIQTSYHTMLQETLTALPDFETNPHDNNSNNHMAI